jgi:hypothetical protein
MAKIVFAEMRRQGVTYDELEWRAGVLQSTVKAWRGQNRPNLESLEAALGALGWAVVPVPRLEHLPPDVQAGLDKLAEKWGDKNALLCQLLATVCRVPLATRAPAAIGGVAERRPEPPKSAKRSRVLPGQASLFEGIAA